MINVIMSYYYKKPNFLPLPERFFEGTWKIYHLIKHVSQIITPRYYTRQNFPNYYKKKSTGLLEAINR